MLNVLHRTVDEPVVLDRPTPGGPRQGSPPMRTPPAERGPTSWPFGAKVIVALLAVLALAGGIGTIIGWTSDDEPTPPGSGPTVAELQETIGDLTAERDLLSTDLAAATLRVGELETSIAVIEVERDAARAEVVTLDEANQALVDDQAALEARVAELEATIADTTDARDELVAELVDANALVAELESDLAEANASVAELESDLATQRAITATVVSQRDALRALFPLELDATLAQADLAGDYEVDITSIYCEGFPTCGTVPSFDELTIVETSNGWLRVEIDGYFDAGLYLVDGALFAIAETSTAVPACGTVPRQATVSLTLYAHGLTVDDDGGYVIDDLGASMMVQAPSTASCARGLGFYGLALTPAG